METVMNFGEILTSLGISPEMFVVIIVFIGIWELVWNGLALWKSAQNRDKGWFIAMLLINDLGILEMLYYFVFSKKETQQKEEARSQQ